MFGLKENDLNKILEILKKYKDLKVLIFGSRANNTYTITSDIDLAIYSNKDFKFYKLYDDLNNLDLIYKLDIIDMRNNLKEELVKSVENEGILIYGGKK